MLGILLLVAVGFWFNKMGQNHGGAKPWVWVISGIGSYFVGQIIAGLIIGIFAPDMLDDILTLILIGLVTGFAGVFIARQLLINYAKKNQTNKKSPDVIDDQEDVIFDDLLE